jgi:hypothetical protein
MASVRSGAPIAVWPLPSSPWQAAQFSAKTVEPRSAAAAASARSESRRTNSATSSICPGVSTASAPKFGITLLRVSGSSWRTPCVMVAWMSSSVPPHSQSSSASTGKPPGRPAPPSAWQGAQFSPNAARPPALAKSLRSGSAAISSTGLALIWSRYLACAAPASASVASSETRWL